MDFGNFGESTSKHSENQFQKKIESILLMVSDTIDTLEVLLFMFLESEAILENYRNEISELPQIKKLSDLTLKRKYEGDEWLSITHMDYM